MQDEITTTITVHPLAVRVFHWLNALAIILMILSGWRIYNASPLFSFSFPNAITLGGWLGGALQWHFAAMWLLFVSFLAYSLHGIVSGHFRRSFFPVGPAAVLRDIGRAMRGKLGHQVGTYNAVQRAAYLGVIGAILVTLLSGLAIWKPVQFQQLAAIMGGYNGARLVHFLGMSVIVAFIVVHLALVLLVPSTLLPMILGWARTKASRVPSGQDSRT